MIIINDYIIMKVVLFFSFVLIYIIYIYILTVISAVLGDYILDDNFLFTWLFDLIASIGTY